MTMRRGLIIVVALAVLAFGALYSWQAYPSAPVLAVVGAAVAVGLFVWAVVIFRRTDPGRSGGG